MIHTLLWIGYWLLIAAAVVTMVAGAVVWRHEDGHCDDIPDYFNSGGPY